MHRTQIQLERHQYEQLRTMAHRERISIAEAVRRLVTQGLAGPHQGAGRPRAALLLDLAGTARGGPTDLGRAHDRYLGEDADR